MAQQDTSAGHHTVKSLPNPGNLRFIYINPHFRAGYFLTIWELLYGPAITAQAARLALPEVSRHLLSLRRVVILVHRDHDEADMKSSGNTRARNTQSGWLIAAAGLILSLLALKLTSPLKGYLSTRSISMALRRSIPLNDGHHIPWLGFGTGTALYRQDATSLVKLAIETGVTHLDGAQVYANEDSLGDGIKAAGKPRSELYVTTKLNTPLPPGETVKDTLEKSLKKLQLDYVDLFLIHSPLPSAEEGKLPEIWKQMEEVQAAGLTKSIGVSNFRVEDLQTILESGKVVPAVNQVRFYHVYMT